jgi:peptidoglycan hydrolase CwlO-like protein
MLQPGYSNQGNRAALKFWCAAVLLLCTLGAAHAALFDDDEARRQIAVEKQRVNELKNELAKQQEAVDARIGKLEEAAKAQPLLDLFTQFEALKLEMSKLRGQVEVLNNSIENTGKRQGYRKFKPPFFPIGNYIAGPTSGQSHGVR